MKDFVKNYLARAVIKLRELDVQKNRRATGGGEHDPDATDKTSPEESLKDTKQSKSAWPNTVPMHLDMDDMDAIASEMMSDDEDGNTPS